MGERGKKWAKERKEGAEGVKKRMGGERRDGEYAGRPQQMKEKKSKRKNPASFFEILRFLKVGGRKKSEGGGRGANLTSNAARQGMKMQESGFPHFFVTTKGLVSNPENKISTKNERGRLRQR